jgi:hypothetical protein
MEHGQYGPIDGKTAWAGQSLPEIDLAVTNRLQAVFMI